MFTHAVITTSSPPRTHRFSLVLLLWLAGCFGLCGLHRMALGRWKSGLLFLVTFGLLGIGQFFDWFRLGSMVRRANRNRSAPSRR